DLVLHQRDERADDDGRPLAQEPGQLIAERLAGAGRHHEQHILAVEERAAGVFLQPPEAEQAEALAEGRVQRGRHLVALVRAAVIWTAVVRLPPFRVAAPFGGSPLEDDVVTLVLAL